MPPPSTPRLSRNCRAEGIGAEQAVQIGAEHLAVGRGRAVRDAVDDGGRAQAVRPGACGRDGFRSPTSGASKATERAATLRTVFSGSITVSTSSRPSPSASRDAALDAVRDRAPRGRASGSRRRCRRRGRRAGDARRGRGPSHCARKCDRGRRSSISSRE